MHGLTSSTKVELPREDMHQTNQGLEEKMALADTKLRWSRKLGVKQCACKLNQSKRRQDGFN